MILFNNNNLHVQIFHPLKTLLHCPIKYRATTLVGAHKLFDKEEIQRPKSIYYYKKCDAPKSVE